MAFGSTSKANLLQTAYNVAATIVAAELTAGVDLQTLSRLEDVKNQVFADLTETQDANPEPVKAAKSTGPFQPARSNGGGGGKVFTAEEAAAIDIRFGKFQGMTLGDIMALSGTDAARYGYGEGDRTGRQYIEWLAADKDGKGSFVSKAAKALVEGARA